MKSHINRRRHPRLEIDIPAAIEIEGQVHDVCRLLNFSRGGAYLTCHDPSLKTFLKQGYFAEQERQEVLLKLPSESLRLKARVVYFNNDGLGLSCSDADGARLYESLHAKSPKPQQVRRQDSEWQRAGPVQMRQLLDQIEAQSIRFLEAGLSAFFSEAQTRLQHLIAQTSDPQEESAIFYTLNSLEQDRELLSERFIDLVRRGFSELAGEPQRSTTAEEVEAEELALVEKREIDTWILINEAARRVESELSPTLYRLEAALSHLCQGNVHNELNPISPISLLTHFKSLLDDYDLEFETVRLTVKAFRDALLGELNPLYDDLVNRLRQQGIVEQDDSRRDKWSIAPSQELADRAGSAIGRFAAFSRQTPTQDSDGALTDASAADREVVLSTLATLSGLQGETLQQQIEKRLLQETARPVKLSPEARSAIGAGEELVAELSRDPLITHELRGLLGSLKFLVIEAVLQDTSLLDNPQHPVRRLLDTIESLKPYVNTGPHPSVIRDRDAHRLVVITQAVESGRIEHVNEVTQEIQALLLEQRERFEKNRRLAISRCLKDEKLKRAQIHIHQALSDLLLGRRVSVAVDHLFRFGWVNLLVQKAVLGDEQQAYLQVVESLAGLGSETSTARAFGKQQRETLLVLIRKGFNDYPVYPEGARHFERTLATALQDKVGEGGDPFQQCIDVDKSYLHQFFRGMGLLHEAPSAQADDTEWCTRVDRLALDTWLIERTDQGVSRVLSLAWKNPATLRYLLVDGHGFKALDEDLQAVAGRFAARRITPMEQSAQPVIERTIESILSSSYDGFKQESSVDPLTGLSNRRAFETELRKRLNPQAGSLSTHVLLLIDLDKFKVVNDLCGLEGGDRLLQMVTDILLSYLPEEGFLARIGDDEFCLLLQGQDLEQGYLTAETMRAAIDEYAFEWGGRMIPSSASFGIVYLEAGEQTPAELMQAALAACNMAKEGGGNCTRIYLDSDSAYQDHQQLVQSLPAIKEALTKGRMELFVQPIVPLRESEELSLHHEILLRIRNEAGELVSPQEFVCAAEQYDMMRAVDRWVVEAFFALVEPYIDKLPLTHSFSINLSGKSMGDGEFKRFLKERISSSMLPTRLLGFEITETALVGDISETAGFIEEIRELGCSFSLDDFGSGYASFSYLKDFPVDFVKIDGVFVREILNKPADYAMINSITEIAHFMDKRVIAEYVTDEETGQALKNIGVDYGQGYHFGKPRPLKEVLNEVAESARGQLAGGS